MKLANMGILHLPVYPMYAFNAMPLSRNVATFFV